MSEEHRMARAAAAILRTNRPLSPAFREQAAQMIEALGKIAAGDGTYGAQAHEYKQIARAALAQAKGGDE